MDNILNCMAEAVRECARIMTEAVRSEIVVDDKWGHANFVTTYDKKIQDKLKQKLLQILPEAVFVGEEDGLYLFSTCIGY